MPAPVRMTIFMGVRVGRTEGAAQGGSGGSGGARGVEMVYFGVKNEGIFADFCRLEHDGALFLSFFVGGGRDGWVGRGNAGFCNG